MHASPAQDFDPTRIERPDRRLLKYYFLCSLVSGPFAPIVLLPLWMRYVTLRYRFDDTGVSMQWGVLFRQEVYLTYRRIQDIHLTRNLLQRWMGLAKISLQTASGSSQSEMTIEGILEVDELRTFLYSKMRGSKNEHPQSQHAQAPSPSAMPARSAIPQATQGLSSESNSLRSTRALEEIRDALQVLVANQKGKNS